MFLFERYFTHVYLLTYDLFSVTCKLLGVPGTNLSSGIYSYFDQASGNFVDMYCDYDHSSGYGYTYFSQSAIEILPSLGIHYEQKDHVIIRHLNIIDEQYESTVKVLPRYQDEYNVSLSLNSQDGFEDPGYYNSSHYVLLGFIPSSFGDRNGTIQGYLSNGVEATYTNCDNTPYNFIAITPDSVQNICGCCCDSPVARAFMDEATPIETQTYLPVDFYFPTYAIVFGGCGTALMGYFTNDTQGIAFGIPFDKRG